MHDPESHSEASQQGPGNATCCPGRSFLKAGAGALLLIGIVGLITFENPINPPRDRESASKDAPVASNFGTPLNAMSDGSIATPKTVSANADTGNQPEKNQPDNSEVDADSNDSDPSDDELRKQVIGTWQDNYKGKRVLTVREDGTATMVVEPSGFGALFAAKMTFEMNWSIEDGRLKKKTTGGKPETKVNLILKTMGDRVDEPILELTDERLLLLDKDGETKYDWKRVKEPESDQNKSRI